MHHSTQHGEEHSRERQLWCAVIFRAVQDATQSDGPTQLTAEQKRLREDAHRWFIDNGKDYCYACESAGLDSEFVRTRVLRYADRALAPGRPVAMFGVSRRLEPAA